MTTIGTPVTLLSCHGPRVMSPGYMSVFPPRTRQVGQETQGLGAGSVKRIKM